MKRRNFNIMTAAGVAAASAGASVPKKAWALTADDAATLKTTRTPFGGERAGNADGTIPAWTGENLPLPEGPGPYGLMPDFFATDPKIVSIDASNYAQYKDKLSPGIQFLFTHFQGYRIDVYPTHRTGGIATQECYDNTAANVTRVVPAPGGSRFGFTGGYGGLPFPILNTEDPYEGGAQAIINHYCRWFGPYETRNAAVHTVIDGQIVLATGDIVYQACPYYFPGGSPENYNGYVRMFRGDVWGPPQTKGQSYIEYDKTDLSGGSLEIWQYLNGQGRVRKAPELQYDTPETQADDVNNYDEAYMWRGGLNEYDWKLLGKQEMYVPYNNNKAILGTTQQVLTPNFLNPDYIRWELHRVYVVEATLHPGSRNVLPHRFFYVDEDTSMVLLSESYDAAGNFARVSHIITEVRPDIPAVIYGNCVIYNISTGAYSTDEGPWNEPPLNGPYILTPIPLENLQPTAMAAQQQY